MNGDINRHSTCSTARRDCRSTWQQQSREGTTVHLFGTRVEGAGCPPTLQDGRRRSARLAHLLYVWSREATTAFGRAAHQPNNRLQLLDHQRRRRRHIDCTNAARLLTRSTRCRSAGTNLASVTGIKMETAMQQYCYKFRTCLGWF